ncbi:MAG: diguanylate cyclase, partial [Desulfobacterales bacterium]|nr:diguanylate cyclase [Desulfobacterales bacterium]
GAEPKACNGVLDLRDLDLQKTGPVKLDGDWQFRWNRLLDPGSREWSDPGLTGFYPVPRFWTAYPGHHFPAAGRGTYRLIVRMSGKNKSLALQTPELFTEYCLWINGRLIRQNGILPGSPVRFLRPDILAFSPDADVVEIVLQMKNRRHGNAGIAQSFMLGTEKQIYRKFMISTSMEIMLISICLFAGFYHTIIFLFRPKERELFYFGLFCFMVALRTLFTGTTLISWIIPDLVFSIASRIATVSIPCCVILFQYFTYLFFKKNISRFLFRLITGIHLLYAACIPFVSTMAYSVIFKYYLAVVAVSVLFVFYMTFKAIGNKTAFAMFFLSGSMVLAAGVANDMLHYLQVINTGYYLALFFLGFILIQSLMLAIKFSQEHRTVAMLSEKLKVVDHLKDEFLANTSHELRTPVNGIIGLAESLIHGAAGPLSKAARQNLSLIASSGKRLSTLINDVLDFSKLRNNDILMSKKPQDLRQMVSVVMTVIRATTPNKEIQLINEIPEDAPFVHGDENRLQQILYNLIGNGVKYTEKGYVRVRATPGTERMEIRVEDSGMGIEPSLKERIFNSFEQGDGSIEREYKGTGLGLPITKKLVELHGGVIRVESKPGHGASFIFTLPQVAANEKKRKEIDLVPRPLSRVLPFPEAGGALAEPLTGNRSKKVLIVDDEAVNGQVLLNYLGVKQLGAEFVPSGRLALERIKTCRYDLVLLDIMMPRMSGYEVCRKLRETFSTFELPVIFLTAKNQPGDIVTAFEVGANDYIVKPVDRTELFARIDTHLSLKNAAANAIENARLANIDPLTGLYNRRYFMDFGKREFETVKRKKGCLSVIMIDIDYFKEVNDEYGHDIGDRVLKQVASIIRDNLRATDIPGRYGGDEFMMILPGTDIEGAIPFAEKIRAVFEKRGLEVKGDASVKLTLSLGVAHYAAGIESFAQMLKKADEMLYKSKKGGRNRISFPDAVK